MYRSFLLTSCALISALAGGCGSLASNTENNEPLAVLEGELTNPDALTTSSSVRVAVIWNCGDIEGEMYRTSQEVEVQPVFPSRFRLELTEPPPAGCMIDPFAQGEEDDDDLSQVGGSAPSPGDSTGTEDPDMPPSTPQDLPEPSATSARVALGTIAAYDDLNGNGKLDLVGPDAQEYVDAVLGTNESLMLVYFEGSIPQQWDALKDSEGNLPTLGYNLLESDDLISTPASDDTMVYCGYDTGDGSDAMSGGDDSEPADDNDEPEPMPEGSEDEEYDDSMRWLSADTFFVLTMSADARFASMMCRDSGGLATESSAGAGVGPIGQAEIPDQYPASDDPGLTCMPDGLSYYFESCVQDGVCSGKICTGQCWYVPDQANPPADWPCLIEQ